MSATQSPGKILKIWNRVTERFGIADESEGKKGAKKPNEKDKAIGTQQERVAKGLTRLRNVTRGGIETQEKVNVFNKTQGVVVKSMKKYCKLIKSYKPEVAKDINKLRKATKQLTVVVENLDVAILDLNEEGEPDLNVLEVVDTTKLDREMEDPNFGEAPDEDLDGDGWQETKPSVTGSTPSPTLGGHRSSTPKPTPTSPGWQSAKPGTTPSTTGPQLSGQRTPPPKPEWQSSTPSSTATQTPPKPMLGTERDPNKQAYDKTLLLVSPIAEEAKLIPCCKVAIEQGLKQAADQARAFEFTEGVKTLLGVQKTATETIQAKKIYDAQVLKLNPALENAATTTAIAPLITEGRRQAEELATRGDYPQAGQKLADTLKTALTELKSKEAYESRLSKMLPSFNNAKKTPTCEPLVTNGLSTAANQALQGKFTDALATLNTTLQTVSQHLRAQSELIAGEATKLRDKAQDDRYTLKTDQDIHFGNITTKLKAWDLVGAQSDLEAFKKDIAQAPKLGRDLGKMQEVRSGHTGTEFQTRGVGGTEFSNRNLQNASFARNTEQGRSAAVRLISPNGGVDLGAEGMLTVLGVDTKGKTKEEIAYLVEQMPFFFGSDDVDSIRGEVKGSDVKDLPQSKHAVKMLKKLKKDENLRKKLEEIDAPDETTNPVACNMIRATLGMPSGAPLSKAHAQQAATAALLTQLRQTDVGSCFATSMAIQAQQKNPGVLLDDFKQMFATGKITRTSKGKTIEVPLNPEMSTSDLDKTIKLPRSNNNLHATPAFQAVLDSLGVPANERESVVGAALTALRPPSGSGTPPTEDEFTAQKIIAKIVENRKGTKTEDQVKNELEAAKSAFQGQQDNRLLRAWEYTVASTAELDDYKGSAMVNDAANDANDAMFNAVMQRWNTLNPTEQSGQFGDVQNYIDTFRDEFAEEFKKSIRVVYDASVATPPAPDGSSSRGVWVMQDLTTGEKITDKAAQDKHMKNVLAKLQEKHKNDPAKKREIDNVVSLVSGSAISTKDPQQLGGHATSSLVRVFNNNPNDLAVDKVSTPPANGGELLKWMTKATKTLLTGPTKTTVEGKPKTASVPVWNTVHGFSLKVGNPLFLEVANQPTTGGKTPEQVVDAHIDTEKKKNKGIQDTELTEAVRDQIYEKMFGGRDDKDSLTASINSKLPSPATVKDLTTAIGNSTAFSDEGKKIVKNWAASAVLQSVTPPEPSAEPAPLTEPVTEEMIFAMYQKTFGEDRKGKRYQAIKDELGKAKNPTLADLTRAIGVVINNMYPDEMGQNRSAVRGELTKKLVSARPNKPLPAMEQKVDALLKQLNVPTEKVAAAKKKALEELSKGKEANMAQVEAAVNAGLKAAGHQLDPDEKKQRAQINQASVPPVSPKGIVFADSNWGDGDHTTMFSMVVNPLTNEMEMWQMNEDGSSPSVMDSATWISGNWGMPTDANQVGGVI